jgi:hypothetical protein
MSNLKEIQANLTSAMTSIMAGLGQVVNDCENEHLSSEYARLKAMQAQMPAPLTVNECLSILADKGLKDNEKREKLIYAGATTLASVAIILMDNLGAK